ncbi:MAG: beta-ribofuranosylaminobenzene 5'-phosphate synthase family protein [Bacillota bacterium]
MIKIKSPARIHFGQIDLEGSRGRIYGGAGIGVENPACIMKFRKSDNISVTGKYSEKTAEILKKFIKKLHSKNLLDENQGAVVEIESILPFHQGLGSGTQIGLTIGEGLNNLYQLNLKPRQVAAYVDRKHSRSGIGFGVFYTGGFVVDGGRPVAEKENDSYLPPVIFQKKVPENWRVIIVFPEVDKTGLSGKKEINTFRDLKKMNKKTAAENAHLVLLGMLPALMEKDIKSFGRAVTQLEENVGDYFKQIQGGRYSTEISADIVQFMLQNGTDGAGQSSWGPSLYGICADEKKAENIKSNLMARFGADISNIIITKAADQGVKVENYV